VATVDQSAGGDALDDATAAVVAHGLLATIGLVIEAAEMLERKWPVLDERDRNELLSLIRRQSDHVRGTLDDLAHGLTPTTRDALDKFSVRSAERYRPVG
jgi:hypothetical protein